MTAENELTPQVEHERIRPEAGGGGLEGDWPPDWMVTYSDMITILMTFFILIYAFGAAKVDQSMLKFRAKDDARIVLGQAVKTKLSQVTEEEYQLLRDRKSTRLNSSHIPLSRMPSSA